jgi:hypothetical protein
LSVLVALAVGLVFWIVAWALGVKAFDAFLVTAALVVTAAAARMVSPFVKQVLGRQTASPSEQGVERV